MSAGVALAVAAHPDDIEFMMSGALLRLREAGYETHYLNVASGSCGSATMTAARTRTVRAKESRRAARILGAHYHESLVDDLEIFYEPGLLRRLASVIRRVKPTLVLTHALEDYMEDHVNTARLTVTAAFARGMPNFRTQPRRPAFKGSIAVYHALPHGLRNGMGRRAVAEMFVDVSSIQGVRLEALAAHASQKQWLDETQGMHSYLAELNALSQIIGRDSQRFSLAEGWCRHHHLGFCAADADPLRDALGRYCRRNSAYSRWLNPYTR